MVRSTLVRRGSAKLGQLGHCIQGIRMVLFYLAAAFKLWMLIDAMRRRVDNHWYFVIVVLPLGDWAYFFVHKFPELRRMLGTLRIRRPNSIEALTYAVRTTPSAENHLRLGEGLYDAGLHADAKVQFGAVLRTHPRDARALFGLAMTHKAEGDCSKAVERFEELIDVSPAHDDYAPVLELVDTYKQLNRPDEALEHLEQLVRRSPRVNHQLALADHFVDTGRIIDAKECLDRALREFEHSPDFVKRRESSFFRSAVALRKHLETV